MCELYDMNKLYLKVFKKISTTRKIMTVGMKKIATACRSTHCFTEMIS